MKMINVENRVRAYQVNGKETFHGPGVIIRSHWDYNEMVVVEIEGKSFTVLARDLKSAIDNALNNNRF